MPDLQRVVMTVQSKDVRHLVFRSGALDGIRTLFKIMSIEARTGAPA
jgi:hypothetical protein